jgi:replicative DNA helicase
MSDDNETYERTPPHDLQAERVVVGSMLMSTDAIGEVTTIISARDFYHPKHAAIHRAILDLYTRGEPTDQIAVGARLAETGDLARIGGAAYIHDCVAEVPTAANAGYYAKIVRRRARRRRVIEGATRAVQIGYDPGIDDDDVADRATQALADITDDGVADDLDSVGDLIPDFLAALDAGEQQGLSTGLADLDRLIGGLQPGTLTVVAARPSVGKTVVLTDFARAVAIHQHQPVVFFSLEMRKRRLLQRLYAAEGRIPLHVLKLGGKHLGDDDWDRIGKVTSLIADVPLHIKDESAVSITDIAARTRRLANKKALGLVCVDYLQLMEGMAGRGNDNREREVARISRGLKVLAADLEVPIVVAAQLNRGPEQRTDKRPLLSDLRESGSIEADADVVILLHRPDYYDKESERAGEVDLIVAKNRDGATDTVTAAAQLHFARFVDMAIPADSFYANAAAQAAR